jgi:hypothetical protein
VEEPSKAGSGVGGSGLYLCYNWNSLGLNVFYTLGFCCFIINKERDKTRESFQKALDQE